MKIFRREMDRICKAAELRELELKKELEASRIKAQSMLLICSYFIVFPHILFQ